MSGSDLSRSRSEITTVHNRKPPRIQRSNMAARKAPKPLRGPRHIRSRSTSRSRSRSTSVGIDAVTSISNPKPPRIQRSNMAARKAPKPLRGPRRSRSRSRSSRSKSGSRSSSRSRSRSRSSSRSRSIEEPATVLNNPNPPRIQRYNMAARKAPKRIRGPGHSHGRSRNKSKSRSRSSSLGEIGKGPNLSKTKPFSDTLGSRSRSRTKTRTEIKRRESSVDATDYVQALQDDMQSSSSSTTGWKPAVVELGTSTLTPEFAVDDTAVTMGWKLTGTSPLTESVMEPLGRSWKPSEVIHIVLLISAKTGVFLNGFYSALAMRDTDLLPIATAEEKRAIKGLAHKSLCYILHTLVSKGLILPSDRFSLEAEGRMMSTNASSAKEASKRLVEYYERALNLKIDTGDHRTGREVPMIGTVADALLACSNKPGHSRP